MADLLRATANVPAFHGALRLYLVEASPVLRAEQQRRLAAAEPLFADDVAQLPPGPLLLIGNEFLDALPIRQMVRGRRDWAERLVRLDGAGGLNLALPPENPALTLLVPPVSRAEPEGMAAASCPAATALA